MNLFVSSIQEQHDLREAFRVRQKVFVEEQQVPAEAEYDVHEPNAHHYLARLGAVPCGAARWRVTAEGVKLERFAVLPAYRNQAVGTALLQQVLEDVRAAHPEKKIYLHAQVGALAFYLRHGFVTDGPLFTECAIDHYKMVWPPEQIHH